MSGRILDACCGSRMFWLNKHDGRAIFSDNRIESHTLCDGRSLHIRPSVMADFTALPFASNTFHMVVFDPPHITNLGENSWMIKKYGRLPHDWKALLRAGFSECFRVLAPYGTLIFKWNETSIRVSEILSLTDRKPAIGNRCGKQAKSHWLVFLNSGAKGQSA